MTMTRAQFRKRWQSDDDGGGITMDDIAACAVAWGISSRPKTRPMGLIQYQVLKAAKVKDAEDWKPKGDDECPDQRKEAATAVCSSPSAHVAERGSRKASGRSRKARRNASTGRSAKRVQSVSLPADITDIYRLSRRPCMCMWKTREGKTLRVSDMDAGHLINAIRWLFRKFDAAKWAKIHEGYSVLSILNGEMAQDACQRELDQLEEQSAFDFGLANSTMFARLLAESVRRKIDHLVHIPEWQVIRRPSKGKLCKS